MKMQANAKGVKSIYPLVNVSGGVALSRKGALTIGWELDLPVSYSVEESGYDDMLTAMASAIRLLPAYSVVHRQDIYTYDTWGPNHSDTSHDDFLAQCSDHHFGGRRHLTHRSFLYVTQASRNLVEKKGKRSGIFGMGLDVHVPSPSKWSEFRSRCDEFIGVLCRDGSIRSRELTDRDWMGEGCEVGIVQRVMMLGNGSCEMSDIKLTNETVEVYDRTAVSFLIGESDALPTTIDSVSRVDNLSTSASQVSLSWAAKTGVLLDCEHIVNQYIVVPVQDEVLQQLDREKRKMYSGSTNSSDNRINYEEVSGFLDEAYKEGLFLVKAHSNIIAWGPQDKTQVVRGRVSAAMAAMGCTNTYNKYNTPILYYAAIPGCGIDLGEENIMKMELRSALALCTWETYPKGMPGGMLRLCDRMRHIPLELDTQMISASMGLNGNYNMFVLGGSGTGKSFFMNNYLRCCWSRGESVFLIDVGDSYQGLCEIVSEQTGGKDGAYLSWDKDHPFSFACFPELGRWLKEGGGLNTDESGVQFFLSFLQTAYAPEGGWTSSSLAVLTQMVTDFLRNDVSIVRGDPVFDDFFRYIGSVIAPRIKSPSTSSADGYCMGTIRITPTLFDIDNFILSLRAYAKDGSYGFLLNDPHPRDLLQSRLTVFEVDKLSKDDKKFYSLCILCMISAMERKMRTTDGFKNIVIEEAWAAIANDTMAPYLRSLWKTARKFSTSAIVVTQEVDDIINNPEIKTAILDNSDIKVLLDQSNHLNTFGKLSELLSLTPMDRNLVLSINRGLDKKYRYREAFIKIGSKHSAVYGVEVSPEEALVYESNKVVKQPLYDRAAELGSMIKAVREAVEKKAKVAA